MIPDISLKENKEQRTPCVLVLDGSLSMQTDGAIDALNEGLQKFEVALKEDDGAITRVRIMVICMGGDEGVSILQHWVDAIDFTAPTVVADGLTPMGKAMELAISEIENEKTRLKAAGISYTRPWVFLMSDGGPNDDNWKKVAERSCTAQSNKQFVLFPVGTGDSVNKEALELFALDKPMVRVDTTKFGEMFEWLSNSLSTVSQATPGEGQVSLAEPQWGTVEA